MTDTNRNPTGERPSQYDGTQYVVAVDLADDRQITTADAHAHVYGVRLDDGAKPWPYYRDAATREWWSLSTPTSVQLDALAWMIDLGQLRHRPPDEAERFLDDVLLELEDRAARLGGTALPECTVPEAVDKMHRVARMLKFRDYEALILVAAPEGRAYDVAEWWTALEGAGLTYGDGNLFWLLNEDFEPGGEQPCELFCAEPYSRPGYFHRGDLGSPVGFPDVALRFRVRDIARPVAVLRRMAGIARRVADRLGAELRTEHGEAFDLTTAESRIERARRELRALQEPD